MSIKIVNGTVLNTYGEPIINSKVEVYLKYLRSEKLLGESYTDQCGRYSISYNIEKTENNINACQEYDPTLAINIFAKAYICKSTLAETGFDMFCQDNQQCSNYIQSNIVYNASDEETIELVEGGTVIEPPKYDKLTLDIRKLIYDMNIIDLEVNSEHDDIEYVANLLGLTKQEVLYIIICHRLEANPNLRNLRSNTHIDGYVYYPFLELNILNQIEELIKPLYEKFDDIDNILKQIKAKIISLDEDTQKSTLLQAIELNLIDKLEDDALQEVMNILNSLRKDTLNNEPHLEGGTTVLQLLGISGIPETLSDGFSDAYIQNGGDINKTVQQLQESDPTVTDQMARDLRNTFVADTLGLSHEPITRELVSQLSSGAALWVADFASFDEANWELLIRNLISSGQLGYPEFTPGDTEEEKIANYAQALALNYSSRYPVAAAAHAVAAEIPSAESARAFFAQQAPVEADDYPIYDTNIDGLLNLEKAEAVSQNTIDDAKKLQRILRITLNKDLSKILYENNYYAQSIYLMGQGNFIEEMSQYAIEESVAQEAYENATIIYYNLLSEFARLNVFTNSLTPNAVGDLTPSDEQLQLMKNYSSLSPIMGYEVPENELTRGANYNTLFSNASYCECEQCRSVQGAASYMVDTLNFLSQRNMKMGNESKKAKDLLFTRRADIGNIELSCKNTNTAMPYIDLVCEILENEIKPNNAKYQTTKTEDELRANPEHINHEVYKTLSNTITTKGLPFNLYNEEAREYLKSISINLDELIELFGKAYIDKEYIIALENLALNYVEGELLLNPDKDISISDNMSKFTDVLNKTGLTYNQLQDVLATEYSGGYGALEINNANSCNISEIAFSINYYTIAYLLPVLVRLQRITKWRICDLDRVIKLTNGVDKNTLINIEYINSLQKKLGLSIEEIINFYSYFDRGISYNLNNKKTFYLEEGQKIVSLYDKLFLNETILNKNDIDLAFVNINGLDKLLEHKDTILAGLNIKESDLKLLLENLDSKFEKFEGNIVISLQNLSILTRYSQLAQVLSISIKDLISKIEVIYGDKLYDIFISPKITTQFITNCEKMEKYDFDVRTLKYLLKYTIAQDSLISKDDIVKEYIISLRNEFATIDINSYEENIGKYERIIIEKTITEFKLEPITANFILNEMLYNDDWLIRHICNIDVISKLLEMEDKVYKNEISFENFATVFETYYLIYKITLLINKFKIDKDELSWIRISQYSKESLNLLDFESLPVNEDQEQVSFDKWLNLAKLYELKKLYPKHDEISIFNVLESTDIQTFNKLLVELTYWDKTILEKLQIQNDTTNINENNIDAIFKYIEQMREINKIGIKVDDIFNYVDITIYTYDNHARSKSTVNSIKKIVKAKFTNEEWLDISANIQDKIRIKKRDALVAYLLNKDSQQRFKTENDLYEFFLIDTQMSPCQLTTRILQANATIQLFAQRGLMNLESYRISEIDSDWQQWNAWMKNYRVWEANRRIFLYPENWIEPELRDDKTPFFKEFEEKLNQNEVTNDYVEDLFIQYLEKVEEIANLEICTFHKENQVDLNKELIHILGRTHEQPRNYYYRTQEIINGDGIWNPWEKINVNINSDHMVLFVMNKRPHLFWLEIEEKPYKKQDLGTMSSPGKEAKKYWNLKLNWSIYKNNNWSSTKTFPYGMPVTPSDVGDKNYSTLNLKYTVSADGTRGSIRIYNNISNAHQNQDLIYYFDFSGKVIGYYKSGTFPLMDHYMTVDEIKKCIGNDYPITILYENSGIKYIPVNMNYKYNYLTKTIYDNKLLAIRSDFEGIKSNILTYAPCNVIIPINSNDSNLEGPFIYQDNNRSYYMTLNYKMYYEEIKKIEQQCSWDPITKPEKVQKFEYLNWQMYPLYHPYINDFSQGLIRYGIAGILNRQMQLRTNSFNFKSTYQPNSNVKILYGNSNHGDDPNKEIVDFSDYGSYSMYNWEIFFHIPMLIANKLNQNQRFEEARKWYHYIFDPTSTSNDNIPNKYWITKPFYKTTTEEYKNEEINKLMKNAFEEKNTSAINAWRRNPFSPHLIARTRTVAYQKNVVMKYIDNLIDWGDQLFRINTFESINEAVQLYVLAANILGPKPTKLPPKQGIKKTYNSLNNSGLDAFGNAIIENAIRVNKTTNVTKMTTQQPIDLSSLYFCITPNYELIKYWDIVADRLFKIRNCMNIEGILQQLKLFEPPIDPAILVKATASNVDINSMFYTNKIGSGHNYRFKILVKKASELCIQLQHLGKSLLKILETNDAEGLANIVSTTSTDILDTLKSINEQEVSVAQFDLNYLNSSKEAIQMKKDYYSNLEKVNAQEIVQRTLLGVALATQTTASIFNGIAGYMSLIPQVTAGANGIGGSPKATVTGGGKLGADSANAFADMLEKITSVLSMSADLAGMQAETERNYNEWQYEAKSADSDMKSMEEQIKSAEIKLDIANLNLKQQILQIRDQGIIADYFNSKYTSQELYNWLISQVSTVYFKAYNLAFNVAQSSQIAYNYELGRNDSFIEFGYWDSLKKGLMAGEKLYQDIKTMEISYMDENARQYELTKNISLNKINPIALQLLKETGYCHIRLPELLFDMDYHDHYFRRIKSVSISILCEKDPYTTASCTLTLLNGSKYRVNEKLVNNSYSEQSSDENRFVISNPYVSSIATSSGKYDNGMFELNFEDDRYLPFEGAGVISEWLIELNSDYKQFDFDTITDVIIHMDYTAKQANNIVFKEVARKEVKEAINKNIENMKFVEAIDLHSTTSSPGQNIRGLYKTFSLKNNYSADWVKLLNKTIDNFDISLNRNSLNIFNNEYNPTIMQIELFALMKNKSIGNIYVSLEIKNQIINYISTLNENEKSELKRFEYNLITPSDVTWQNSNVLYGNKEIDYRLQSYETDLILNLSISKNNEEIIEAIGNEDIEDLILVVNYKLNV